MTVEFSERASLELRAAAQRGFFTFAAYTVSEKTSLNTQSEVAKCVLCRRLKIARAVLGSGPLKRFCTKANRFQ